MFHNHDDDLVGIVDVTDFFWWRSNKHPKKKVFPVFLNISKCHDDIDFYEPNLLKFETALSSIEL